jgi:hypothetical protein
VHVQIVYAVIDESVFKAAGIVYRFRRIAKLVRPYLRVRLIALAGLERAVAALLRLFHLAEYLFQRALAYGLLSFGSYFIGAIVLIFFKIAIGFQVFYKIASAASALVYCSSSVNKLSNLSNGVLPSAFGSNFEK